MDILLSDHSALNAKVPIIMKHFSLIVSLIRENCQKTVVTMCLFPQSRSISERKSTLKGKNLLLGSKFIQWAKILSLSVEPIESQKGKAKQRVASPS